MGEIYQELRFLSKAQAEKAKEQIIASLNEWAKIYGLDDEQIKSLVSHVCSNAIAYSFSIGEDTEVSALDVLQEDLLSRISSENHHTLPVLFAFAVRYAQIDVMEIV